MQLTRRNLIQAGVLGATAVGLGALRVREAEAAEAGPYAPVFPALDAFALQYMREMNSPGMTLVLADREAVRRVVTYGYGDLEAHRRVREDELFQIGSISKSFVAIALLQLRDEGKLDDLIAADDDSADVLLYPPCKIADGCSGLHAFLDHRAGRIPRAAARRPLPAAML